jgi:RNA polymerase sigma-70 factor (ECF subfamily)
VSPPTPEDYRQLHEGELQQRYHDCDPRALEELFRRHEVTLRRCACLWAWPDRHLAEDAVQDLYLRLADTAVKAGYGPSRPWLPWALWVLHNLIRDAQRRQGREKAHYVTVNLEDIPATPPPANDNEALADFRQAIDDCLNTLGVPYQTVLVRSMQGLTLPEIQQDLGIPYGTAGTRLFRAREAMRDCLRSKGYLGGDR